MEPLRHLMLSDGFLAHGYRHLWTPGLVELHVISDALQFRETVRTLGLYWLPVNQAPPLRTLHAHAPRSE
jgi:hypothetical protein